ncbi:hypothetical protein ASF74_11955 [Arthrobacter sp. Leaf145]|nr:hypothetical protein ASF74_11955 [Arthrobacter sp. Leaf145]
MTTTITQDRHTEVVDAIVGLAPDGVAYVPSASIAPIINGVLTAQTVLLAPTRSPGNSGSSSCRTTASATP